jgi:uncharacterized membrane protein YphA (DoxX/SURF4 family)
MKLKTFAQNERLRTRLATVLDLSGAAGRATAPVIDLLVRLALAKAFFAPGMFSGIGGADLPTAWPMIVVQVIGPVLMAIGLLSRPVALLMLVLTLRAQFWGTAQDEHLFWAALFGWYVVHGPTSLSLDRLLSNGMRHSPLPLAPVAIALGDWVNRAIGPFYMLAMRLWLADCPRRTRPLPHHAAGHAGRHAAVGAAYYGCRLACCRLGFACGGGRPVRGGIRYGDGRPGSRHDDL